MTVTEENRRIVLPLKRNSFPGLRSSLKVFERQAQRHFGGGSCNGELRTPGRDLIYGVVFPSPGNEAVDLLR
jgi:hypothetical protein